MTTTTELLPALNPIQLLNEKIASKRREAHARLQQLRHERAAHEKTWPPVIPVDAGPGQAARLETAWQDQRDALRRAERNFSETGVLMELDDERGSKSLLVKALAWLQQQHAESQKRQADLAKVKQPDEGRHVFQPANTLPPHPPLVPHASPVGGLFGVPILAPIEDDFRALTQKVEVFPDRLSFVKVVEMVNALASRLHQAAPPLPMAKRMDKGFVPLHG